MNDTLKTFSNNSLDGHCDDAMNKILENFKKEVQPYFNKFISECEKEKIEYYSVNGALYKTIDELIICARIQSTLDLELKKNDGVSFNI